MNEFNPDKLKSLAAKNAKASQERGINSGQKNKFFGQVPIKQSIVHKPVQDKKENSIGIMQQQNSEPARFIPMPDILINYRRNLANFGMLFQKYASYDTMVLKHQSTMQELFSQWQNIAAKAQGALEQKNARLTELLSNMERSGLKVSSEKATLNSSFITGIGNAHPGEVGMTFDRNTGLPYIPASSIKGAVRMAFCYELFEASKNDEKLKKQNIVICVDKKTKQEIGEGINDDAPWLVHLFGYPNPESKNASRGQVVFLDAFPTSIPKLHLDIMNPHYGKYYQGSKVGPVETENPVPIKFITVESGSEFIFRYFIRPLRGQCIKEDELKMLHQAVKRVLEKYGLGAKTSIGYGRFNVEHG